MIFVKWNYFTTPKIELLLSVNLPLCMSSCVLAVVQIIREKSKECYINDVLNTHGVITSTSVFRYVLNITSLGPALFSNESSLGNADNRNSHINLVIDNTNIIDRYKNLNILLFKETLKIN